MFWKRKGKKTSKGTDYDSSLILPSMNRVPVDLGYTDKFMEDGRDCYEKEYKRLQGRVLDSFNTDVRTSPHSNDSNYEIAKIREAMIEDLFCNLILISKELGEMVVLCEKEGMIYQDIKYYESKLLKDGQALEIWRRGGNKHETE